MRLDLTEDQISLMDGIERLCGDAARVTNPTNASERVWNDLARMGWLGLATPEARGGVGGSALEVGLLMRAAGRHALVTPFFSSVVLGARILALAAGSPATDDVLAKALNGDVLMALAHQEGDQFDPVSPAVTATLSGGRWRLVGQKTLSFGAADADWLLVSATVERSQSVGLFLVNTAAPGVKRSRFGALRGTDAADVMLDATVPNDACLVEGPAAAELLSRVVDEGILALAWEALGAMTSLFEQTVAYVKVREQFGRPIATFQTVQHRIAEMAVHCEEAQSILELASLRAASPERRRLVSAAKAQVGRGAKFVAETAVQLHGGVGVTEELQVARFFRLLTCFQAVFGTVDQHLARYAAATLPGRTHSRSVVLG